MGIGAHEISITLQTILAIFGAIAATMAGISAIAKMLSPFKDLKETVNKHENALINFNKRFEDMERSISVQQQMQREICKSLVVIMNHDITGNSVDKLKAQQEELQRFLIEH